jgi:MFS superfamily sulfate permease-like transporter
MPPTKLFGETIVDGIVVAIVAYAISISMAQSFAKKKGYTVDANQELLAHGITNFVCSNFKCYMMSVSLSRSLVQESLGGVTQIAGLVAALLMLVVLLALAGLFKALPSVSRLP